MKFIANFSRVLVGCYLIFSGFLKIVDPYGTALKLKEYFEVFAEDLPSLSGFFEILAQQSIILSVVFCCLELLIGVALLFKFKMRFTVWAALMIMLFFTFLTFYSAYFNKVTDCGCFGEFLKLSPWSSFWKNVVTMAFILIIFSFRKSYTDSRAGTPAVLFSTILSLGIAIYSLSFLPIIDMLPYAVGKSIPEQMKSPDIKPEIAYEFLDKTTNEVLKTKEYLMDTTKYQYQDSKILNADEIKPIITDFAVNDSLGNEVTESVLVGRVFLIVIKETKGLEDLDFSKLKKIINHLNKSNISPVILTSDLEIKDYIKEKNLSYNYYFSDEKVLKTMARNNPVIFLLDNGKILGKWSLKRIPNEAQIKELIK